MIGSLKIPALRALVLLIPLSVLCADGQTNLSISSNRAAQQDSTGQTPATGPVPDPVMAEQMRASCLQGRRCVCGRILKVLPAGLVVESGYPSLLRTNLHGAWLIPGTVSTTRDPDLVESRQPDSICVGTVFLTDLPRLRGARLRPYDYVVLHAYPAGQYTYDSVGDIQRTVRRFAGGLETAVKLSLQQSGNKSNAGTVAVTNQIH